MHDAVSPLAHGQGAFWPKTYLYFSTCVTIQAIIVTDTSNSRLEVLHTWSTWGKSPTGIAFFQTSPSFGLISASDGTIAIIQIISPQKIKPTYEVTINTSRVTVALSPSENRCLVGMRNHAVYEYLSVNTTNIALVQSYDSGVI